MDTKGENGTTEVVADLDLAAEVFAEQRPRMFGIAYRMLGSATEAEDVVQDAWLRWQRCDRSTVGNAGAYLATTTTRLAINATRTARARRETYVGPWLPEPVDTAADPYLGAERAEALEFAVLILMEHLSPNERAAYVLREAFDYPYGVIAEILRSTEPAVRQLVSRARKSLVGQRRVPVPIAEQRELLGAFLSAARSGDVAALEELFAPDVVNYSDGGGRVRASRIPVFGAVPLARTVRAFAPRFWTDVEVDWGTVNGRQSALLRRHGVVFAVLSLVSSSEGIEQVLWMMNPDKLNAVSAAGEPIPGR